MGLHVLMFSDNVPIEDEVSLKQHAKSMGLFMMGPDCGTAVINGAPLGFANAVPKGRVGLVSASGSGLQQVSVSWHKQAKASLTLSGSAAETSPSR